MPIPASSNRSLAVLCAISLLWAFSFGAGAPLASLWLQDTADWAGLDGWQDTIIGLNTATYYLGIALTAITVPGLLRRWGRGCILAGIIGSGLTVAYFPWAGSFAGWFLLRLLMGTACALSLIPLETLVNHQAEPERRSRDFGFYAFSIASGMALGTLLGMELYGQWPRTAFLVGGGVTLSAGLLIRYLPLLEWATEEPVAKTPVPLSPGFLSFGSAWCQGFLEGGMIGLLPLFLLSISLTKEEVGWLMSGIMIGVILFQIPIAWLADRAGRIRVLVGCYLVTLMALSAIPYCPNRAWLGVMLFLTGACSGAFYPLGLAVLGERVPAAGLARANAWYLAINCLGSLSGPALTGLAMDLFGKRALFTSGLGAVLLVLLLWIVIATRARRPALRRGEQADPTDAAVPHAA